MDSDVQDVFVNHTKTKGGEPFDPKRLRKEARARARLGQLHDPRSPPPGFGDPQSLGLGLQAVFGASPAPAPSIQRNLQEFNALHSLQRDDALQLIQTNLSSLLGTTAAPGSHHTATEDPPGLNAAPPSTSTATVASLSNPAPSVSSVQRLLGMLDRARGGHQQQLASPQGAGQKKSKTEAILGQLLSLTDEYLNHPGQSGDEPIRMALNLLKIQGQKLQVEQDKETVLKSQLSALMGSISGSSGPQEVAPASIGSVSLLSQALQAAGSARMPPLPPHQQQQTTLGGGSNAVQHDLFAQIIAARGQNSQAQQQPPPQDADDRNNSNGLTQESLARYLAELQRQREA